MDELQESNGITYQEDEVIENDAVVEDSELATDTEETKPRTSSLSSQLLKML